MIRILIKMIARKVHNKFQFDHKQFFITMLNYFRYLAIEKVLLSWVLNKKNNELFKKVIIINLFSLNAVQFLLRIYHIKLFIQSFNNIERKDKQRETESISRRIT